MRPLSFVPTPAARVRRLAGSAAALLTFVSAPVAAAAPQATTVPGLGSAPDSILLGADGAMWMAQPADPGVISRVTTAGAVTEYRAGQVTNFHAGREPSGLAITPEGTALPAGTMWFRMDGSSGDDLGRISPAGAVSRYSVSTAQPTSLTGGPDGKLWMTAEGRSGTADAIIRFDAAAPSTTMYRTGLTSSTNPRSITTGPDGALWFVEGGGLGRVGRITTAGELSWQTVGGAATTLAAGPLGAVWYARANTVGRVADAASGVEVTAPSALAAGPDGALWVAGTGSVTRLVPGAAPETVTAGLPPSARGTAIAAGPDGRMWLTLDRAPYLMTLTVPPALSGVAATAAGVTATVTPNGLETTLTAEVRTPGGEWRAANAVPVGAGTAAGSVELALSGLAAGTEHTVRVTASNAAGSSPAATATLTTAPAEPVPPVAEPTPVPPPVVAAPVPVQGESVVLAPASGIVLVRAPGQRGYTTLTAGASLPVGALIDTSAGSVVLSSQVGGKLQSGTFHGGKFRVSQLPSGMTELALAGALDCGRARAAAAAAGKERKRSRQVWGRDRGGKFRTQGSSSVATVRGTRWLTRDTCAGTLVRVREGAVSVRPLRGGRAKLVRAGREHFTARR